MTAEATAPPRSRGALGLMSDPVFGALFWGKMFAVVAVWTHGIVAAIVIYDATQANNDQLRRGVHYIHRRRQRLVVPTSRPVSVMPRETTHLALSVSAVS
jgi:hypothetical protein